MVPCVTVVVLAVALRLLWNSPWSPQKLRDMLDQAQSRNDRIQSELQRGEAGLSAAQTAIKLEEMDRDRLMGLAGIRPSTEDSVPESKGLFARDSVPDVGALLARAHSIRQGYDQLIDWFGRHPKELGRLPTIRPIHANHPMVGDFGRQTDPFTGQAMNFPGVTWAVPIGTPVWATGAGTVIAVGDQPRWGKFIEIRHDERVLTIYAHLSRIDAVEGATVNRGQVIGLSGQTGKVIAPAVFYAVYLDGEPIDPTEYLLPETSPTTAPAWPGA